MVDVTPIRPHDRHLARLPEANGDRSSRNGKAPRRETSLPFYRSILALDIEGSTRRTNPVKEEHRELVYRLVMGALVMAGIDIQTCDPLTDRGDGVLVLMRPTDDFPKPFLVSRLLPAIASLLSAHNSVISPAEEARILRMRAVVHAGEVHHDGNGPFGEDLDLAFRLLDAPRFKDHLKSGTSPLAVVASDSFYQSIIRHGYDGIDHGEFLPLVNVNVGNQRRKGWVHAPHAGGLPLSLAVAARLNRRLSGRTGAVLQAPDSAETRHVKDDDLPRAGLDEAAQPPAAQGSGHAGARRVRQAA